jgi:HK97 family phage portal protein
MSLFYSAMEKRASPVSDLVNPSQWLINLFNGGTESKSGIRINADSAMKFSAVYGCGKILAETVGSTPVKIYRKRKDGKGRDEVNDHRNSELLRISPDDRISAATFREGMTLNQVLSGNCFAVAEKNDIGEAFKLTPYEWYNVQVEKNKNTGNIDYWINDRNKWEYVPPEKMFHVLGLGWDWVKGLSPIGLIMEAIGIGLAAETFAANFYSKGVHAGGIVEYPEGIKDREQFKKDFLDKYSGLARAQGIMFLESGSKYTKLAMPMAEAQFIETRKFQIEEIARIYRIPLHMLQSLDRATFSNIEHQSLEFIQYTMLPWFVRWEQEINRKLFTPRERKQGFFAEFVIDGWLRGDVKSRYEAYQIGKNGGFLTTNDIRAKENMNPAEDGSGDQYWHPLNMVDAALVAKIRQELGLGGGNSGQGTAKQAGTEPAE